jgi:CheY-like chemotaxis protein
VLTVDDSSVARKQVTRCLQTVGVEVVALNGQAGAGLPAQAGR